VAYDPFAGAAAGVEDGNEISARAALLAGQDLVELATWIKLAAMVILSSLRRLILGAGTDVVFLDDESARWRI